MKTFFFLWGATFIGWMASGCPAPIMPQESLGPSAPTPNSENAKEHSLDAGGVIRFATYNVALNRKKAGDLIAELKDEKASKISKIAQVIQVIKPDVILLNEVDYDEHGQAIKLLQQNYLGVSQGHTGNRTPAITYPHVYLGPVNTGLESPCDLNQDGKIALPDDGYGYGAFPGQYGMVLLSKYPIEKEQVRTFQNFLWRDMPDAKRPRNKDGSLFYPQESFAKLRLASKSVWDVPITIHGQTVHLICAHPTPPVFDGAEDRNGCRNHDEIRMVVDYAAGNADYIYDDKGVRGGLAANSRFVIVGDMNADPFDGDSLEGAAQWLTESAAINHTNVPSSWGATRAASRSGEKNQTQRGDPAHDTGDFNDQFSGNLRVDYCLPSRQLRIVDAGVFWPHLQESWYELNQASDHHLVWVDVEFP